VHVQTVTARAARTWANGMCGASNVCNHPLRHSFLTDRRMPGVDILCTPEQTVNAPFDGQLTYWRPLGSHPDHQCLDKGVRIDGTGQWLGRHANLGHTLLSDCSRLLRTDRVCRTGRVRRCARRPADWTLGADQV
jgi:hypothetical protein